MKRITLPLSNNDIDSLVGGEEVLISGVIYTARDAAHKRMKECIEKGESLPFDIKDAAIYYAGPCPAKPGQVIGSCGPTTSCRMDAYAPMLYNRGLKVVIGKGDIGDDVKKAITKNNACYFAATGGAAALLASCIKACDVIGYEDLGPESVKRLEVLDMPLIVAVKKGYDIYKN